MKKALFVHTEVFTCITEKTTRKKLHFLMALAQQQLLQTYTNSLYANFLYPVEQNVREAMN